MRGKQIRRLARRTFKAGGKTYVRRKLRRIRKRKLNFKTW